MGTVVVYFLTDLISRNECNDFRKSLLFLVFTPSCLQNGGINSVHVVASGFGVLFYHGADSLKQLKTLGQFSRNLRTGRDKRAVERNHIPSELQNVPVHLHTLERVKEVGSLGSLNTSLERKAGLKGSF